MVPWVVSCVRERWLRDGILRAQVVVEGGPVWAIEAVVQVLRPRAIFIAWPEVDPSLPLCFNPGHVAQLSIDLRAPGGAQGTLLAPGLAVLAAAFCVCGAMAMQGLAAYIIGDFFPANVHVDVMVRQVLCAAGAVHTVLLAEVQGERGAAEAVERAFCVHTLAILTGHGLALIDILTLPALCIVLVARIAHADVARHCVEAPAILAQTRPEHHTLIGICVRGLSKHPGSFHRDVAFTTGADLAERS